MACGIWVEIIKGELIGKEVWEKAVKHVFFRIIFIYSSI